MSQRLSKSEIKRLAQRWREYQESITGLPTPPVPHRLQAIADATDAQLLLSLKPELAQFTPSRKLEVSHGIF